MARFRRFFLLLPLLSVASFAAPVDPSSLLAIQARLDSERRTSDGLRAQLDQSRADAAFHVKEIRAASETIIHQLRTELDAALAAGRAAESLARSKDSVIGEVRDQAVKAVETESQAKAIAVIAVTASQASEVKQTQRHKETIAGITDARSEAAMILQQGIKRLVKDADERGRRIVAINAERADRQKLAAQLQVIEACGGVFVTGLLLLNFMLLMSIRRKL